MIYRIGELTLDVPARELRRDDTILAVRPKVFDLIETLVRHRHRTVDRAELIRTLWPDTIVSDSSLSLLVKDARKTVGDTGTSQRRIRTTRGTGYRFVGEVELVADDGPARELEALVARARSSFEAALEEGTRELQHEVDQFLQECQRAIEAACVRSAAS